jgi:hypothetical protein
MTLSDVQFTSGWTEDLLHADDERARHYPDKSNRHWGSFRAVGSITEAFQNAERGPRDAEEQSRELDKTIDKIVNGSSNAAYPHIPTTVIHDNATRKDPCAGIIGGAETTFTNLSGPRISKEMVSRD